MANTESTARCCRCGREISIDDPEFGLWEVVADGMEAVSCQGCLTEEEQQAIDENALSLFGDDLGELLVELYHRTPDAERVLTEGFEDGGGTYGTDQWFEGVWLSDRPLEVNDGIVGTLLMVEIPEAVIVHYEWVEDGKLYREWLVPAEIVNRYRVQVVVEDER